MFGKTALADHFVESKEGFVMLPVIRVICLAGVALMAGCTAEAVKRTAYETLQNIGQQECEKSLSPDCDKRETYDQYRREREKLSPPAAQ
jgi:hypothetical protein